MPKELTPQQEHQRKVWDEARTCKPREPLTDEQIAEKKARGDELQEEVNVLLGMLNEGGVESKARTTMTILIDGQPRDFNLGAVESALRAQNFGWSKPHDRNGATIDADRHLFPGIKFEKEGEKVVKKVYTFDCVNRKVSLVVTRCTPLENGDTWDTPRYDESYESVSGFDNLHWRCIVNDMISLFGDCGFVHLYSRDFQYVWDHETCLTTIKPKQDDGTFTEQ